MLADDHPLVLWALEQLFAAESDCQVLASCSNGSEALAAVGRHKPDILILDSQMPGPDSLEVIRSLARSDPQTRIVLHTESSYEALIRDAVRLGVRGVILKELPHTVILQCVRRVDSGDAWLEWRSASRVLGDLLRREQGERDIAGILTPREREILILLCRGLRNKEIAQGLSISDSTVKAHLRHMYEKLHVSGRFALVRYAEDKGVGQSIRP